ncbi:hypothetical protein [Xanthobacter oligotrophicus]|uniref:hypothetical protein n=1 Tax=Xanthobacter oligotrophicus TaxID=2607286 RepID=UPI0011F1C4F0|nr:hypothetical protein [Xanthobacter oligotrophicus]MCG5236349.1 hypothetical protein [Xanthobacter oligotrophicus]
MNVRTHETMVTFEHPFRISGTEGVLPPGTYRVVIDEEQILGLSFIAYRRVATLLHTPAVAAPQGRSESLAIDAADLEAALLKDRQQSAESRAGPSSVAAA